MTHLNPPAWNGALPDVELCGHRWNDGRHCTTRPTGWWHRCAEPRYGPGPCRCRCGATTTREETS